MSKPADHHNTPSSQGGSLYAIAAYATWGFVPLFWRELRHVPPLQILAHRILWSVVFFICVFSIKKNIRAWTAFALAPGTIKKSVPAAVAIGVNWGLYIFAVNSGHALESSLGYFINPIFNVIIGSFFFHEKLNRWQQTAFALACAGVVTLTLTAGKVPWIALSLAGTFTAYGVIRKKTRLGGAAGTAVESALLIPVAAAMLLSTGIAPVNILELSGAHEPAKTLLLLGFGGALTALPLVWFAEAAQRLPLSTLGFYQYISPTFQFLIAVFVFKEDFGPEKFVSFLLIWTGLAIFAIDSGRRNSLKSFRR
ncbi:MAG: EamA family transporter RarD [Silvanigrellaceae bacterium]